MKANLLSFIILLFAFPAYSQTFSITGRLVDQTDTSALIGVGVAVAPETDSTQKNGTASDDNGNFRIGNVAPGTYILTANYVGFKKLERRITVTGQDVNLGTIKMQTLATQLKNVVVEDKQIRAQQNGDTTQFNANAYKVNPDANAEDLVNKMPGITSDANGVKANGEDVKQVYVDGKPFFGDDPTATLKNLPAEVIDKIQVFDKMSDQAQFTGFDDGNTSKAINIITRRGKNNGQFGKVYAGYGTDDRYTAGGNINFFNGDRRISVIGMSNNINQQNFSSEDILGVTGNQGGQNRGGAGRGSFGGRSGSRGSFGGGGGDGSNFLVGQQAGITTTNSIGLNYSDNWGKKIKISGSYFFNSTNNSNNTELTRNYFTNSDSALVYNENNTTTSKNMNHRANLRLEYNIDSSNSLLLTPRLSVQNNKYTTGLTASSTMNSSSDAFPTFPVSSTINNNSSNNTGYSFSNDLLYRHKFRKQGRTLSLDFGTQLNEKDGTGELHSTNIYSFPSDSSFFDQQYTLYNNGYTLSGNVSYTEPLGKGGQLMINYSPSYNNNRSDKETDSLNSVTGLYDIHVDSLSNKFDNTYMTRRGGVSYRLRGQKLNFMAGVNGQYATLEGVQTYPYAFNLSKNFTSILPQAMFNYRFSKEKNLRIFYRTSTNPPSVTQLQNVVDVSNPLLLKTGNPDLKQDYTHTLIVRYGGTNAKTARSLFAFLYGSYVQNYIANATYIPTEGAIHVDGITVPAGSQLTRPVNLNGYYTGRGFLTLGLPVEPIKSNLNLNAGLSYAHSPGLINDQTNYSNNYTVNGGLVLGSNISQNVDFTLSYSGNYNLVKNTLQTQSDNTYYSHTAAFKINWMPYKGLVVNTDITNYLYSGLTSSAYNQSFFLWNAYVGYKFLKNRALELRASVFDILNQNKSIARTTTETYIEDSRTQVLTQYFMFTATYTLRNFKAMASPGGRPGGDNPDNGDRGRYRPDGMEGQPRGGGHWHDGQ
ncbi:MAG: TonB-dependent receptor [Bacteroidetes bacterium]|nr:TonB-dependent receptor [Bacteroidota bacterium]